jgi:hypothetical protein
VLVGMQVPLGEWGEFDTFLAHLGYPHEEETNNEVYTDFLC